MLKKPFKKSIVCSIFAILASPIEIASSSVNTYHHDFRNSVKLDSNPRSSGKTLVKNAIQVKLFLTEQQDRYALQSIINDLVLTKQQASLLGTHYHYQQQINGIPIDGAEIIVSVSKQQKILKIFNNTFPILKNIPSNSKRIITKENAEEFVWDFLQSTGKLFKQPQSQLLYINRGSTFKLAYKVNMVVSQPFGDWVFYIDAVDSKLINAKRIDLPIAKNANEGSHAGKWPAFAKQANHINFKDAIAKLNASPQTKNTMTTTSNQADATALVFDPDPRTTLGDESLEDTSPNASFDAAYFTRTLSDITLTNGTYSLTGPWVTIADFDLPTTPPSTSTTGIWDAKRGDNAFNDAMTYFHIDQNQRYIQSLGFVDATGIQFAPIEVDTDGRNGDDQSVYSPSTNQLIFGHGCVDDNEDTDVILHEYGHAINYSINSNYSGGDTGAMGEGFGDYWGASYSYSTPNGRSFRPEWAFSWDGHSSSCWPGRVLNQTSFRYNPSSTYAAHAIVNGILGNELWSTPLTESLIELLDAGIPRSQVDQIILEAKFGLGGGLTMPDVAASIVKTAVSLFPNGPHAGVFNSQFKLMNIIGKSLSIEDVEILQAGDNTIVDPGENVSLNIRLKNVGGLTVTAVNGTVTSNTTNVSVEAADSSYPAITSGNRAVNNTPFEFTVPVDQQCDSDISLSLVASYNDGTSESVELDLLIPVGAGTETDASSSPASAIPDNLANGVSDQVTLVGAADLSSISIDINITHSYRGDLTLTLTSPEGVSVDFQTSSTNDAAEDIIGNYPQDITPSNSLSVFDGTDHNGVWTLKVVDSAGQDIGTLNSWRLISTSPRICNGNRIPLAEVVSSQITVEEGLSVVLDASPSSDPDGDTITFNWAQISGSPVELIGSDQAVANVTLLAVGSYTFEVTVSDPSAASDTATVTVTVAGLNQAPVASVVSSVSANEGGIVSLDASGSQDADGDQLTFQWSQTGGPSVAITNASSAVASVSTPQVSNSTQLTFDVAVSDPSGAVDIATVTVTVNDVPASNNGSSSGGGSFSWLLVSLLSLIRWRRKNSKS